MDPPANTAGESTASEGTAKRILRQPDADALLVALMDPADLHSSHLMNPLEERIGYKFRNSLLLAEALTHASISLERKDYPFDNQRLEFLGDAVLQVVITEELFSRFPDFTEGQLTKLRHAPCSRERPSVNMR